MTGTHGTRAHNPLLQHSAFCCLPGTRGVHMLPDTFVHLPCYIHSEAPNLQGLYILVIITKLQWSSESPTFPLLWLSWTFHISYPRQENKILGFQIKDTWHDKLPLTQNTRITTKRLSMADTQFVALINGGSILYFYNSTSKTSFYWTTIRPSTL